VLDVIPKLKDYERAKTENTYLNLRKLFISEVLVKLDRLKLELKEVRRVYEEKRRGSSSSPALGVNRTGSASQPARGPSPVRTDKPKGTMFSNDDLDLLNQPSSFLKPSFSITPNPMPPAPSPAQLLTPAVISPGKIFEYISSERNCLLFLDMRGMAAYAQGHLAWKRPKWMADAAAGKATREAWEEGAVCCMEPEWFSGRRWDSLHRPVSFCQLINVFTFQRPKRRASGQASRHKLLSFVPQPFRLSKAFQIRSDCVHGSIFDGP